MSWTKTCVFFLALTMTSSNSALGYVKDFAQDSIELSKLFDRADSLETNELLNLLMDGIDRSRDHEQIFWQGKFALRIALYYGVLTGQPDSLYKYALEAEIQFEKARRYLEQARSMMFLGIAEFQLGHEEPSMDWYTEAGELYRQIGADSLLASLYINIGHSIKEVDYPLYVEYLKKANDLSRRFNEPRQEAITCLGLTDVYIEREQPDSATRYIHRALALAEELNDNQLKSYSHRNLAITEESKSNRRGAIKQYHLAIDAADNLRDKAIFEKKLGEYYFELGHHRSADRSFQQAETRAKESGATQLLEGIYGAWRHPLEKSGDIARALAISKLYIDLKDSLHNENIRSTVAELTSKYEVELKERENQQLLATNIRQELDITQLSIDNRNRLLVILLLSAGLILGWFYYRNRQRSNGQKLKIAHQDAFIQKQKLAVIQKDQELVSIRSIVQGQEEERSRIARELHDGLGGIFSTIKISLDHITKKSERLDEHEFIGHSRSLVDKASKELRRMAQNLMPSTLNKFGLIVALEDLMSEIGIGEDIKIDFQHYQVDLDLPEDVSLSIYRVIQELLHNAIKHANASEILLQLVQHQDHLEIVVEDNGQGFEVNANYKGSGIQNIESRLLYLNAIMKIDSQLGDGASITIELPLIDGVSNMGTMQRS